MSYQPRPLRTGTITKAASVGDVETLEPCALLVGTYSGASAVENNAQKTENRAACDLAFPLLRIHTEYLRQGLEEVFVHRVPSSIAHSS